MSKETMDFINKYAQDVIKSTKGTRLLPSIKMAQMIIESSGEDEHGVFHIGKGLAARKANNYFGIKADSSWTGGKMQLSTPKDGKPVNFFRVYPSALDSLKDHTAFLVRNPRYQANGVFTSKTPREQAEALQRAGYSESATYANALMVLVQDYNLTSLDA